MKHAPHAKLLPGLGPEHVNSVLAIRKLKARSAIGVKHLADVALSAIEQLRDAWIDDVRKHAAAQIAGLTVGKPVGEYLIEQSIEARERLTDLQTTISTLVRGLLPPGHQASWRRGLGVERPRSVWA